MTYAEIKAILDQIKRALLDDVNLADESRGVYLRKFEGLLMASNIILDARIADGRGDEQLGRDDLATIKAALNTFAPDLEKQQELRPHAKLAAILENINAVTVRLTTEEKRRAGRQVRFDQSEMEHTETLVQAPVSQPVVKAETMSKTADIATPWYRRLGAALGNYFKGIKDAFVDIFVGDVAAQKTEANRKATIRDLQSLIDHKGNRWGKAFEVGITAERREAILKSIDACRATYVNPSIDNALLEKAKQALGGYKPLQSNSSTKLAAKAIDMQSSLPEQKWLKATVSLSPATPAVQPTANNANYFGLIIQLRQDNKTLDRYIGLRDKENLSNETLAILKSIKDNLDAAKTSRGGIERDMALLNEVDSKLNKFPQLAAPEHSLPRAGR